MKFINQSLIESVNKGEVVSVLRSNGKPMNKEYCLEGYCRTNKAYELVSMDDINDFKYLKKGKLVLIR